MGLSEKKEKQQYGEPNSTVFEVSQEGVICASETNHVYNGTNTDREEHWTIDHRIEETTPDDEWEEEQEQDWGDSWGEY